MEMDYFHHGNEIFPLRNENEMTFPGQSEEMTFPEMISFHYGQNSFPFP